MTTHVAIIGSGIAAISAAIEVVSQGATVTVIGGRPGATALHSGAWDIASDPTRYPHQPWNEILSPLHSLEELKKRQPNHLYHLIAQNGQIPNLASFLVQTLKRLEKELSYPLHGSLEKNFLIPTPLGTVKTTAFVGPTQGGNLLEMQGGRLLIIGIKGLSFPAQQLAATLKDQTTRQPNPYCSDIMVREISIKHLPTTTSMELAMKLDEDPLIDSFHETLLRETEQAQATHVLLPPVIGLQRTSHIFSRLRESKEIVWFESLAIPPSIPGLRLHHRLEAFLKNGKVHFIEAEVSQTRTEKRRVLAVKTRNAQGQEEELLIDRLVLATGKFIGGGLNPSPLRESLFDLPVPSPSPLLAPHFFGDHRLLSAGLRVGPLLQPVDEKGRLAYENLWAAGSVIGGYQATTEGCGMGVAVATGTLAGRLAVHA
ncbi:MAG: anaerobic glycerol-3-phosphate dehydrogenase subunit B [Deltaproteobacteria bacterium]|nr:anaerobic glycerol-3-phosphate dehydrogenase subunit B [Deltaproteobacteria bacterium]